MRVYTVEIGGRDKLLTNLSPQEIAWVAKAISHGKATSEFDGADQDWDEQFRIILFAREMGWLP